VTGMRVKFFYRGKPVEVEGDFEITVNEQGISIKPMKAREPAKREVKRKTQKTWRKWTPEEDSQLVELLHHGMEVKEIAAYMGRTEGSIKHRIRWLREVGRLPRDLTPQKTVEEQKHSLTKEPVT